MKSNAALEHGSNMRASITIVSYAINVSYVGNVATMERFKCVRNWVSHSRDFSRAMSGPMEKSLLGCGFQILFLVLLGLLHLLVVLLAVVAFTHDVLTLQKG